VQTAQCVQERKRVPDGAIVATKLVPLARFDEERKVCLTLSKSNECVQLLHSFEDSKSSSGVLVFEHCASSLEADLVARSKAKLAFSEDAIRLVLLRLARALQAVHGSQLVHGDVAPRNVLFRTTQEFDSVVLCDFGCTAEVADDGYAESFKYSSAFLSPEAYAARFDELPTTRRESDAFSLGCIALSMMLLVPPGDMEVKDASWMNETKSPAHVVYVRKAAAHV
jgi:serine/threonine protein kinase